MTRQRLQIEPVCIIAAVFLLAFTDLQAGPADPGAGELIVFVQPGGSELSKQFEQQHLPMLRGLVEEMHIQLRIVDVAEGAPEGIGITPLLVFQNFRGRSIYQGRFANQGRIRNFIRTSHFVAQQETRLERQDIRVWRLGRAQVAAPLKLTPVTGSPPEPVDSAAFESQALEGIDSGLQRFRRLATVELRRSDRLFYMDFHSWCSAEGQLHVTTALFSQFHCETPVYARREQPFVGPWEDRQRVFAEAAADLEAALVRQLSDAVLGDGFEPINAKTAVLSWDELGLALPERKQAEFTGENRRTLQRHWRIVKSNTQDPPPIQFRFPAPLDHYRGIVGEARGNLLLGEDVSLEGARGWVEVATASVSMGDPELDATIHGGPFLDASQHPVSRFRLDSIAGDGAALEFGRMSLAELNGHFELRGLTVPVKLQVQFEPILDEGGVPLLLIQGAFQINVKKPFGMLGADGPAPASETVIINLNLRLEEGDPSSAAGDVGG